jgi:hypothetical protein
MPIGVEDIKSNEGLPSPLYKHNKKKRSRLFEELILKSWWTILFFLICFFAYDQAAKRRDREEYLLQVKLDQLLLAQQEAGSLQEGLQQEIASQEDDSWIELVLMQKLGLVPEGQTKVHFIRKDLLRN